MKYCLSLILIAACLLSKGQISFEELEFENKSTTTTYKPDNKNYAFVRSKKGEGGLNKNSRADSILDFAITKIVLVFTEMDPAEQSTREDDNRARWENLLRTYPEYFDYGPAYVNVCQCNPSGDAEAFKQSQGFYIYFEAEEPVVEQKKAPAPAVSKSEEKKTETKKSEERKPEKVAEAPKEEKKVKEKKQREEEVAVVEEPKKERTKEEPVREKKEKVKKEEPAPVVEEADNMEVVREAPKKRTGYTKPRKARDPRACGPPCYENGDEDLNAFFRDNVSLTKKQRKQGKKLLVNVRLQLNFDGSVKKSFVTGPDEEINKNVLVAINMMNLWNPAVKNGTTVKSEVKFALKYDRDSKGLKAADFIITPRPSPKCTTCVTASELVN